VLIGIAIEIAIETRGERPDADPDFDFDFDFDGLARAALPKLDASAKMPALQVSLLFSNTCMTREVINRRF